MAYISETSSKASCLLNLLRRSMHNCSKDAKKRAYIALVRPHLEYCSPVWSPHQLKLINTLEKVQQRAARWVCGTKWDPINHGWTASYATLYSELKWPSLQQRRSIAVCHQMYKIVHNLDCIEFDKYFIYKKILCRFHPYSLSIPSSRINVFRFSFFINAPHLWNDLPSDVVQLSSFYSFKSQLKSLFCKY